MYCSTIYLQKMFFIYLVCAIIFFPPKRVEQNNRKRKNKDNGSSPVGYVLSSQSVRKERGQIKKTHTQRVGLVTDISSSLKLVRERLGYHLGPVRFLKPSPCSKQKISNAAWNPESSNNGRNINVILVQQPHTAPLLALTTCKFLTASLYSLLPPPHTSYKVRHHLPQQGLSLSLSLYTTPMN